MSHTNTRDPLVLTDSLISHTYAEYYARLCLYADVFVRDHETARDIVHDIFTRLCEQREALHVYTSLPVYIYSMVRNRCLNFLRDQQQAHAATDAIADDHPHALHALIEAETYAELHRCLRELPQQSAAVIRSVFFEHHTHEETADNLHITPSTVRNHKARALSLLRDKLRSLSHLKIFLAFL